MSQDTKKSIFSRLDTDLLRETARPQEALKSQPTQLNTERTNVQTSERPTKRHPFDIFEDQLLSLTAIQNTIFQTTRKKPTLGSLVQTALDEFIKKWENVRTSERTK